jgi:transcriptional regulator with XRE-family HTH domain
MTTEERVRARLKQEGVRATDLAKALDVSVPYASQILNEKRGIGLQYLDQIAALLQVPLAELFTDRDLTRQTHTVQSPSNVAKGEPHAVRENFDRLQGQHIALLRQLNTLSAELYGTIQAATAAAERQGLSVSAADISNRARKRRPGR